uniref:Uncharacterized protein n=1 Tax=Arundo donax TaxID=35708 RepID=A0A0A9BLG0_ARUDO
MFHGVYCNTTRN